jgi:hypothetical protein
MAAARLARNTIGRTAASFALGLASHFLLDAIPHSDYAGLAPLAVRWVVLGEGVVILAILAWILRGRLDRGWPGYLIAGIAGAVLPDAKFFAPIFLSEHLTVRVTQIGRRIHRFHAHAPSHPLIGYGLELACTCACLWLLTRFPRTARPSHS